LIKIEKTTMKIIVINNEVEAKEGEFLLAALRRQGIKIPTLCNIDGLDPSGSCRMCVVEMEGRPDLVPSCAFPVYEGLKILTHSERVVTARKAIVELLLSNHPDDCLYCVRNGNCELQGLAQEHCVSERIFSGSKNSYKLDYSSPAIVRDPAKCVLCGKCVRVCEEIQNVACIDFAGRGSKAYIGTAFDEGLNVSSCVKCGQCILVCPTGALTERSHIDEVMAVLHEKKKHIVVQHAPSVSVTVGEEFGLKAGKDVNGIMTAALRKMGFDRVFETSFSADLTIMEEASELADRIQNGGKLPMFTSCSPGWVKYLEEFYPEMIDNLSSCKSPQQMLGAVIKSYYAEREDIDPKDIYSVSVMPCTAKKFEIDRDGMGRGDTSDVDAVLTTREFAKMIRMMGIDFNSLEPDGADTPFGIRSTAGKLFGASGGVMEAALRTAHYFLTGKELEIFEIKEIRGMKGIKEAKVMIGELEVGVAVVNGVGNAQKLLDEIQAGRDDIHFVEIMTCPGGCVAGGGQPIGADPEKIKARMRAIYKIDKEETLRTSHNNPDIKRLYDDYLGKPLGHKSHELLHTHYVERKDIMK
jgi:iron-only hydrogenase group A